MGSLVTVTKTAFGGGGGGDGGGGGGGGGGGERPGRQGCNFWKLIGSAERGKDAQCMYVLTSKILLDTNFTSTLTHFLHSIGGALLNIGGAQALPRDIKLHQWRTSRQARRHSGLLCALLRHGSSPQVTGHSRYRTRETTPHDTPRHATRKEMIFARPSSPGFTPHVQERGLVPAHSWCDTYIQYASERRAGGRRRPSAKSANAK